MEKILKKLNVYLIFLINIFWMILIYVLTTFPVVEEEKQESLNFLHFDKVVHFFLFGICAFLLILFFKKIKLSRNIWLIFNIIIVSSYSFSLEMLQKNIPGRLNSVYDFLFSFLGVISFNFFVLYCFDEESYKKCKT